MDPIHFLVTRDTQKLESDLRSWSQQVLRHTDLGQALRQAQHCPNGSNLVRSLAPCKSNIHRAKTQVENHLLGLVDKTSPETARTLYRQACGHWPRVARALDTRARSGKPS